MEGSAVDPIEILSSFVLHEHVYQTLSFLNLPVGVLEIDASAVAASYAIRKIPHYLQALRQFEDRRRSLRSANEAGAGGSGTSSARRS